VIQMVKGFPNDSLGKDTREAVGHEEFAHNWQAYRDSCNSAPKDWRASITELADHLQRDGAGISSKKIGHRGKALFEIFNRRTKGKFKFLQAHGLNPPQRSALSNTPAMQPPRDRRYGRGCD
jgi:hypothetical protein